MDIVDRVVFPQKISLRFRSRAHPASSLARAPPNPVPIPRARRQIPSREEAEEATNELRDAIESGAGGVEMSVPPGASLDKFFEDVESIKDDLRDLERIQRSLHDANEGGKSLHDAAAVRALRARMEAYAAAAIKKAKDITELN